jgi:hypothetical protein
VLFLDLENAFDTTWHLDLLRTLSKLNISIGLIKLISSFLETENSQSSVEGEMSSQEKYKQVYHKVSSCPQH